MVWYDSNRYGMQCDNPSVSMQLDYLRLHILSFCPQSPLMLDLVVVGHGVEWIR